MALLLQLVGTSLNRRGKTRPALKIGKGFRGDSWLVGSGDEDQRDIGWELREDLGTRTRFYEVEPLSSVDASDVGGAYSVFVEAAARSVKTRHTTKVSKHSLRWRLEDYFRSRNDPQLVISAESGSAAHIAALLRIADDIGVGVRLAMLGAGNRSDDVELVSVSEQRDEPFGRGRQARLEHLSRVPGGSTLLLLGETGVGKTFTAAELHRRWRERGDRSGALGVLNCAAIPKDLLESELFGHVKGAFTGADKTKKGFLEAYEGGTVLLDEIGELPANAQAKLLTVLQGHERKYRVRRVGETTRGRLVDLRFLFATNVDLFEKAAKGEFRQDLLARIATHVVRLHPLRERPDLALIAYIHQIQREARRYQLSVEILRSTLRSLIRFASSGGAKWTWNYRDVVQSAERVVFNAFSKREAKLEARRRRDPDAPKKTTSVLTIDDDALGLEIATLTRRWGGGADDQWDVVRKALGEDVFAKTSQLKRWEARFMIEALERAEGNRAAAWKLLIEEGYLPDKLGNNPSGSYQQKWKRLISI